MIHIRHAILSMITLSGMAAIAETPKQSAFVFDPAEQVISVDLLDNANYYDADIARIGDDLWITWLEFVPGQGDHIYLGRLTDGKLKLKRRISSETGQYANPTITITKGNNFWLSYETQIDGQWDVLLAPINPDDYIFPKMMRISTGPGPDIHHCAAAAPNGDLWIAWQSDVGGQFDILARRISDTEISKPMTVSDSPQFSDWHPELAVSPTGIVHVVWDAYDGQSYNIYSRFWQNNQWSNVFAVAQTPAFEGRATIAADRSGRVWIAWEEGSENWGNPYRASRNLKGKGHMEIDDYRGPLHRFRRVRLALLESDGNVKRTRIQLPMPSIDQAMQRPNAPSNIKTLGAFYERAKLIVDDRGRIWLVYRHYYVPGVGFENVHHVEEGWGLYARCITATGWSKLFRFKINQGDGMQRFEATPYGEGIAAIYTTGRTDRREKEKKLIRPRGLALATITNATGDAPIDVKVESTVCTPTTLPAVTNPELIEPKPFALAGKEYHLFYGDLHRHTDLSLCFVFCDGTMDDAYRYAIDVAKLDFLGITDHTRDLAFGDALSQLWWRCRKEVTRHELAPKYFPMYAYERSRGDTDHNVISLRPDMLRPYTYSHFELWKELNDDTITIPHQPVNPATWETQDNARRPLIEIFQGYRNRSIEPSAQQGLDRGYLLGFIASSDHLSTSASYAGVWAQERTGDSIFRAMQARRTFGATDKIRLVVRSGDHWMGERFEASNFAPLQIEADGTTPIESVEIIVDGDVEESFSPHTQHLELNHTPTITSAGPHYLYVRLQQTDKNQAWSSPIWVLTK